MLEVQRRDSNQTGSSDSRRCFPDGRRDKRKERLNTELLKVVYENGVDVLEKVAWLLKEGASGEARCQKSLATACHISACHGSWHVLDILVQCNPAVVHARDRAGRQPHHLAAASGHLEILQKILHKDSELLHSKILPFNGEGVPRETLDSWNHDHQQFDNLVPEAAGIGRTALHLASERCYSEIIKLLLTLGADPEAVDMDGLTALDVAGLLLNNRCGQMEFGSVGIPKFNVSFNRTTLGSLMEPTVTLSQTEEVCSLLIEKGAKQPKAKVIVKDGAVINQRRMNVTAIHTAVRKGDVALTEFLLGKGACLLTWDKEGLTAAHVAVLNRSYPVLKAMLAADRESVVAARDVRGRTPLLQAVEEGWTDGVAILLEAGADVTITSNTHQTVLHYAAQYGWASILEELLSIQEISKIIDRTNSSYESPLFLAVKMSQTNCVKLLCENGADSKFLLLPGDQSLLHIAVMNDSIEILQCLLNGPGISRIDLKTKEDTGGLTPLHIAAQEGYADCADELLAMGADSGIATKRGDTALHIACKEGHVGVVRRLVKHDPGLMGVKNADGWRPLHIAAAKANAECVREMVLHGADLSAKIKYEVAEKSAIDVICSSIPRSVEFLEDIFNHYVEVIKGPLNDPECEILVNYDILMPKGENEKQLKVIGAIMNSGKQSIQDRLMLHPLIESFLHLKWKKFNCLFIFIMSLYFILTLSITTLAHITFVERTTNTVTGGILIASRVTLFVVLIPILFVEIVNLSQMQRYYFMDYESWVKWVIIAFTCVVESTDPQIFWVRYLASVAVLLSWVELLFLLSRCPTWGFYVLMFSKVAIKTLKVLATFSLLIIGFAFSFLILFEAKVPFRNMLESVVKVIVMMVEFDYEDMFSSVKGGSFSVVGRLMFTVFVLLVALVMMNLIVGVAVSNISKLEEQGRTEQLAKQASFLSFLETFLYSQRFGSLPKPWRKGLQGRRSVQKSILVKPGRPSSSQVVLPKALMENIFFNLKTRHISNDNISVSLKDISDRIDNVAEALRDFYTNNQKAHKIKNDKDFEHMLNLILKGQRDIRQIILKKQDNNITTVLNKAQYYI